MNHMLIQNSGMLIPQSKSENNQANPYIAEIPQLNRKHVHVHSMLNLLVSQKLPLLEQTTYIYNIYYIIHIYLLAHDHSHHWPTL